jgi:hypothetical protein
MGFHVTLRGDDLNLLYKLRSEPSEIFGRPYAGYLLFLVGGTDDTAIEWLRKYLVSLDSLTGTHVAFAIFAEKVPVQLEVHDPHGPYLRQEKDRLARFLGDVPLSEVRRIDSYIDFSKHGRVATGDHLNAMTYGSDRAARAFGVLQHLPCLLVLDAIPSDRVDVIEMDDAQLANLFPMLRSSISNIIQDPQFSAFIEALELLGRIKFRLEDVKLRIRNKRSELSHIPMRTDQEIDINVMGLYAKMFEGIKIGSHRQFRRHFFELREYVRDRVASDLDESTGQKVVGYGKTISALSDLAGKEWPLTETDHGRCRELLVNHVARLLPDASVPSTIADREQLQTFRQLLIDRQSVLIEEIKASLPDEKELASRAKSALAQRREAVEEKLAELRGELDGLRDSANRALELCVSEKAPSLSKIIRREAQKHKLKLMAASVADKTTAYAGKLLDPQNLIKLIGGMIGSPH